MDAAAADADTGIPDAQVVNSGRARRPALNVRAGMGLTPRDLLPRLCRDAEPAFIADDLEERRADWDETGRFPYIQPPRPGPS
jgi:hypothetical protein